MYKKVICLDTHVEVSSSEMSKFLQFNWSSKIRQNRIFNMLITVKSRQQTYRYLTYCFYFSVHLKFFIIKSQEKFALERPMHEVMSCISFHNYIEMGIG